MKKSFWLFFIAMVVVCLLLLLIPRRHQAVSSPATNLALTNPPPSQPALPPVAQPSPPPRLTPRETATNIVYVETSRGKTSALSSYLLANWQGPINFYGKVIDENSNPVGEAKVHLDWDEFPTEDGMRNTNTQSDAQGLFSLHGAVGRILGVSVQKDGYYSSKRDNDSYTYGSLGGGKFSPDSQNPVIFHLRKKKRGGSLIETKFPPGMRITQLHHDGTPVVLDLFKGTQVFDGSGQLQLQIWHNISDTTKFDWKFVLSTPNGGGLIPTDEEFAFEAPQNGYQPSIVIDMPATNQDWSDGLSTRYYIQLPNGDYGRFDLNLLAHNGAFTIHSTVNPTGSQNLEPAQ